MRTKEEKRQYANEYYQKNKAKKLKQVKLWQQMNTELISIKKRKYYKDNKDLIKEKSSKHYWENQERHKKYWIEYYKKNRDKILSQQKQYRAKKK